MQLTPKEIQKIAKLSRIAITKEEEARFQEEISSILNWVEQLQAVNTDQIDSMASVSSVTLPLREDTIALNNNREDVLANAPITEFGCYVVPKVVDNN